MKAIFRFLLAILIIALAFAVLIGLFWLLGTAANAIGFLPSILEGDTFEWVLMDGIIVVCMLGLGLCFVGIIVGIAFGGK